MKPYYQDSAVTIYHGDCAEIVPTLGRFDLLLTDPPYGINADSRKRILSRSGFTKFNGKKSYMVNARDYGESNWDRLPISSDLMLVVRGKCTKQIIWGGNYYELPPCIGPLVWDKENTGDFADGEMAWNNLGTALRIKRHMWNGMLRKGGEDRFHPTQKPLEVISWALQLAGQDVVTVLDPFAGSGTTGRACKDLGRKCVLIEREESYCEIAAKRMGQEVLSFHD